MALRTRREIITYYKRELGWVPQFAQHLTKYVPEAVGGLITFRAATMRPPPKGALSPKVKELLFIVLDTVQANLPGGLAHARAAVRAGVTPAEIAEALALTIMLAGLPKVEVTGIAILQEAEKAYAMVPRPARPRRA